jgi:predicted permease
VSIRSWLRRWRLDEDDFQDEVRAHLAIAAQERVAEGEDPEAARYAALREFGNVTLTTEAARRVWRPRWVETVRDGASDVRYALRTLARNPIFALTVVGVLTLGIGLNAAVFTMLKGLALSPLAGVERSASLAVLFAETGTGRAVRVSYPDYEHLREQHRAFSGLMGTVPAQLNLGRGRGARQIWTELVSGNYFQVLGVRAERGRTLLASDTVAPGRQPVVVINAGLWRRDFGGDPGIVGRTLTFNNVPLTVVGVADPGFHGTTVVYDVEAFIPVTMAPQLGFTFGSRETTPSGILSDRRAALFYPQGFLRPGATLAHAAAEADALWASLSRDRPPADVVQRLRVVPFWQTPGGAPSFIMPTLTVLSAMGLLVLTIACANVAGLVLVRGVSRRGEIAVRLALGASRFRVIRLLVVESLVLAVPGAVLGVLLARRALPVLVGYAEWLATPERVFFNIESDALVVGFAALVACGSAIVFGFVPALRSSRVDLVSAINEDASPRGASRGRSRGALVVAQVAVSLLLLVGAGLVTRSLEAARQADPGFDARGVSALAVDVRQNGYDEARGRAFYRELLAAARDDHGIGSAALAAYVPLGLLDTRAQPVTIDGYEPRRGEDLSFMSNVVSSDYFRTLRIDIVAGREFEDRDDEATAPVVVVNRALAQRFWGGAANAIGRRLRVGEEEWRTVVGVAADVKYSRIDEAPRPYFYVPFGQSYRPLMVLHTKSPSTPPGAGPSVDRLVEQARARVASLDPELPILYARPMREATRGALIFFDLAAAMLFVFGITGLALAGIGTYALVSYTVEQSTHEIGIRMALGATALAVVRTFLGRGLRLGAIGAGLGMLAALGAGRFLRGVLFGVSPTDALSFAAALAIVLGGVLVASLVPAWRAARTNPLAALRHH